MMTVELHLELMGCLNYVGTQAEFSNMVTIKVFSVSLLYYTALLSFMYHCDTAAKFWCFCYTNLKGFRNHRTCMSAEHIQYSAGESLHHREYLYVNSETPSG